MTPSGVHSFLGGINYSHLAGFGVGFVFSVVKGSRPLFVTSTITHHKGIAPTALRRIPPSLIDD